MSRVVFLTHGRVPHWSVEELAGVDEHNSEGGACAHLAHQGQGHPHPEVGLGDKAGAEAGEAGKDLADGEHGATTPDVDGERVPWI